MESLSILNQILIFLAAAVIAVPISKKLGLGSVLGYLIAGSIIGPWGFKFITDVENIAKFSEFGVVLLLFVIGLELNPKHLWGMRKDVFGLGALQVLITTLLLAPIIKTSGLNWLPAALISFGLALSSTAFALQALAEKSQLNTDYGKKAFSILLFQDIIVIPFLAVVPFLGAGPSQNQQSPWESSLKALLVIFLIIVIGRYLLRHIFRMIAASKSREIFTGAALLLVLGVSSLMEMVHVSMALGAFIAGLLLAESEYRHELEADIEPFKGLLLGLFFISVGMSVNYGLIINHPFLLFSAALGMIFIKMGVVYFLGRNFKISRNGSLNMALVLPQGGEFAFVLFGMLLSKGILEAHVKDNLVVIVTLSMAFVPLLSFFSDKFITSKFKPVNKNFDAIDEANPVIIAGFGRFGQIPGRILRAMGIGFTALEVDSEQVEVVRKFGGKIYFGDASRIDLLEAAQAGKAKIFILAIDDPEASLRTAKIVRERFPHLKILARARNRSHAYDLMDLGVNVIKRETFLSSLELTKELLFDLGFNKDKISETLDKFRDHDEKTLVAQHKVRHDEKLLVSYSKEASRLLEDLFKTDKI